MVLVLLGITVKQALVINFESRDRAIVATSGIQELMRSLMLLVGQSDLMTWGGAIPNTNSVKIKLVKPEPEIPS